MGVADEGEWWVVSDMEQLAARLAVKGAQAISTAYGPATLRKARLAIARALRELADDDEGVIVTRDELRGLADCLEGKGGNSEETLARRLAQFGSSGYVKVDRRGEGKDGNDG